MEGSTDSMFTKDRMTLYTTPGKEVSTESVRDCKLCYFLLFKKKKMSSQAHELGDTT